MHGIPQVCKNEMRTGEETRELSTLYGGGSPCLTALGGVSILRMLRLVRRAWQAYASLGRARKSHREMKRVLDAGHRGCRVFRHWCALRLGLGQLVGQALPDMSVPRFLRQVKPDLRVRRPFQIFMLAKGRDNRFWMERASTPVPQSSNRDS